MAEFYCQSCHVPLQSRANLCVRCYQRYLVLCPKCVIAVVKNSVVIRKAKGKKAVVDCSYCNNERWILTWEGTDGSAKTV